VFRSGWRYGRTRDNKNSGGILRTRPVPGRRPAHFRYSRRWHFVLHPSSAGSHVRCKGSPAYDGFGVAMPILLSRYLHPLVARGILGRLLVQGAVILLWCAPREPVDTSRIRLASSGCRPQGPVLPAGGGRACIGPTPGYEGA
jgi:hypothetical protein